MQGFQSSIRPDPVVCMLDVSEQKSPFIGSEVWTVHPESMPGRGKLVPCYQGSSLLDHTCMHACQVLNLLKMQLRRGRRRHSTLLAKPIWAQPSCQRGQLS